MIVGKRSRATLLSLTVYQLMTWLPDGKICRSDEKMHTAVEMRQGFVKTAEWGAALYMSTFHIQFLSFPSFSFFFYSFILFPLPHFSHLIHLSLPHLFTSITGKMCLSASFSYPEAAPWIPCTDLYVLAKYITVCGHQVI